MGKLGEYLKTARVIRRADRFYRHAKGERVLWFPELRRKQLNALMRKNSKAIGAAVGGAIALGIGSLFPDLAGTEDLNGLEMGIGALVGAAITTWLFPANKPE